MRTSKRREEELMKRSTTTAAVGYGNASGHGDGSEPPPHGLSTRSHKKKTFQQRRRVRRGQHQQQRQRTDYPSSSYHSLAVAPLLFVGLLLCLATLVVGSALVGWVYLVSNSSPSPSSSSNTSSHQPKDPLALLHQRQQQEQGVPYPGGGGASFPPPYPKVTKHSSGIASSPMPLSKGVLDMCTNTLWHTVETTTIVLPDGEAFVHTGDIDDLWLRDSAAQVHPLLVPFGPEGGSLVSQDPRLDRIVSGLIKRSAMYIRHDPYANAFRIDDTYVFSAQQKKLGRHDLISTWNYELDSACYYMRMLYFYWKQSPNANSPESVLRLQSVQDAVEIMVDLWIAEQHHESDRYPTGPLFDCQNCNKPYRYQGLPRDGKGSPTNPKAGLTWTGFRPSDDACQYGYLVPANMFAAVTLRYAAEMAVEVWGYQSLADKALRLAADIDQGIQEHAIVEHPEFGRIYAYEVDGLGNSNLMDDANVPNLLSIPYLGYNYDPTVYSNTRRFIFSPSNPEYQKATNPITGEIEGYGSPHMVGAIRENIWPMSLAMQGLTSDSVEEKTRLVEQLVKASAGTGWMHESFNVHNPKKFTRSWFCWADSLFAELVLSLTDSCPDPSRKYKVMEWRDPETVDGGRYAAAMV